MSYHTTSGTHTAQLTQTLRCCVRGEKFLNHDTLTDVITFNYNIGRQINGDICISCDRVAENASKYKTVFSEEIARVMVHGVLHLCGYKDSTEQEKIEIRAKENFYLSELFN